MFIYSLIQTEHSLGSTSASPVVARLLISTFGPHTTKLPPEFLMYRGTIFKSPARYLQWLLLFLVSSSFFLL
jgi:hypothetical protein